MVSVADAVNYEQSFVRRQFPFDFIGLGDFLMAYQAYVFGSNHSYSNEDLATSVTAPICPDFASDPKGLSLFFWGVTNYVGVRVQMSNYGGVHVSFSTPVVTSCNWTVVPPVECHPASRLEG